MPMRPELYPDDWREIALAVKQANLWMCAVCDAECRKPGDTPDRSVPILQVAHIDHDYFSPEIQVAALCTRCHLAYDHTHNVRNRRRPVRRIYRHRKQRKAGQLTFFQEGNHQDELRT